MRAAAHTGSASAIAATSAIVRAANAATPKSAVAPKNPADLPASLLFAVNSVRASSISLRTRVPTSAENCMSRSGIGRSAAGGWLGELVVIMVDVKYAHRHASQAAIALEQPPTAVVLPYDVALRPAAWKRGQAF